MLKKSLNKNKTHQRVTETTEGEKRVKIVIIPSFRTQDEIFMKLECSLIQKFLPRWKREGFRTIFSRHNENAEQISVCSKTKNHHLWRNNNFVGN